MDSAVAEAQAGGPLGGQIVERTTNVEVVVSLMVEGTICNRENTKTRRFLDLAFVRSCVRGPASDDRNDT
jgi:hypothetical protein